MLPKCKRNETLVVVLVAQSGAGGVKDIPDANIRADTINIDGGIQSKWVAGAVSSVNIVDTSRVLVLPDTEVAVNEAVVQPENGVGGRRPGVLHDGANAVVSPGVRTTLGATGHVGICSLVVATVNHGRVGVDRLGVVVVAGEAVKVVVLAGADVDG
jgi:hypothetical protein